MALACAEARAADFSDAASDQRYIDAPNGLAIRFDRERQRVISRERLDAIRESRMVGLPSCGTQLGRSALFVDDLDPLVDHFAGEPVGLVQDVTEINLRNVRVQAWHFSSGPTCAPVKMDQAVRWFYAPEHTALKPLQVCLEFR